MYKILGKTNKKDAVLFGRFYFTTGQEMLRYIAKSEKYKFEEKKKCMNTSMGYSLSFIRLQ